MDGKLQQARLKINEIDKKMAQLFEQRLDEVAKIADFKKENNLPIFDQVRENEVINANIQFIKNPDYALYYRDFLNNLMNICKFYQQASYQDKVIGYQGIEGAFGHIATSNLFKHEKLKNYNSFHEVIHAIKEDKIHYGVLPFENSYTGEIGEILDLLFESNLYITEIYNLDISQNLMASKDADLHTIKQVYSHPQAFGQSADFLRNYNFELIPYTNTAMAAKLVSISQNKQIAAIASKETASIYDLKILAHDINTAKDNQTKFIVLSNTLKLEGNRFCLLFCVNEGSGQLAPVINIIAKHGFDLQSIKSRLIKNLKWQYYFYVEVVGNIASDQAKALIEDMSTICKSLRILGTYTIKESIL